MKRPELSTTGHKYQTATMSSQNVENNRQLGPKPTTTVYIKTEASTTLQIYEKPYENGHNHAKVATTILTWRDASGNGHNQLAGSKSKQNSEN